MPAPRDVNRVAAALSLSPTPNLPKPGAQTL